MQKDHSTEAKIREAAKRVFVAKGFDGCSSREIAKEAGMNVALVNYYFRSKSKLFDLIYHAAMEDFFESLLEVFGTDLSLEVKMRIFIEREYDFLSLHPELPGFIINEMNREGCSFKEPHEIQCRIAETGIFEDVRKAQEAGEMRKIDFVSITQLLMSNCHFPFLAKSLVKNIHSLSDDQYATHLKLHKQYVTEMLVNYLFPSQK